MRLELWSDFVCPWCGLAEHRLGLALAAFAHRDSSTLVHRSFELDEHAPVGRAEPVKLMLARKYGASPSDVEAMTRRVETIAAADGLSPYVVGDNQVASTAWAHQLAAWAADQGHGEAAWRALYGRYFGQGRSIFTIDDLVEVAAELGLDGDAAREVLARDALLARVRDDGKAARRLGARGVPFLRIDERFVVSGAQPVATFSQALTAAWEARAEVAPAGERCDADGCDDA